MLSFWSHLLFSQEPLRRSHLKLTFLALVLMSYCAVLGLYAASLAGAPAGVARGWAIMMVGGQLLAYLAIRLGLTRSWRDPGITTAQLLYAVTMGAAAYAFVGPMRAAVFLPLMVIMIFGLYALPTRAIAAVAFYAVVLFGAVMFAKAVHDPAVYPPAVEFGHFLMFLVMIPIVPVLGMRFAEAQARQERQQHDLLRVQVLASRDELTGLINRREMTVLLQRAQAALERTGRPYCVAVIDLDHFKHVNDKYGHGIGDEVLKRFADMANQATRDQDTLARWGGEEFVLLMGSSSLAAAQAGLERLREVVAAHTMVIGPHGISVTMSAGIAEPLEGESYERVLSRADHALYVAKARGRNAVVSA
jgi:diguanylate cyclase (GGDEF)-like protein